MKKSIFFIIGALFFMYLHGTTFSATPVCPEPPVMIDIDRVMPDMQKEALSNIEECLAAYDKAKEASVKEFSCPSGSMFVDDFQGITPERLAYRLGVATMFKYIDDNAKIYTKSLQCKRDRDPVKWMETTRKVIYGEGIIEGYADKYNDVCAISRIQELLSNPTYAGVQRDAIINSSDAFPYNCTAVANKKILALENLATLLASKGVGKGFQNDKDVFLEAVKGKYATLLEKTSRYLRLVSQAVSKMDTYLRNTHKN